MHLPSGSDDNQKTRDYWNTHLEKNPLRMGPKDTEAGAILSLRIENAGDVLRELTGRRDASYYQEKMDRIAKSLAWCADWTGKLSPGELERLEKTKKLLEGLPVFNEEMEVLKELITQITERDTRAITEALSYLQYLLEKDESSKTKDHLEGGHVPAI